MKFYSFFQKYWASIAQFTSYYKILPNFSRLEDYPSWLCVKDQSGNKFHDPGALKFSAPWDYYSQSYRGKYYSSACWKTARTEKPKLNFFFDHLSHRFCLWVEYQSGSSLNILLSVKRWVNSEHYTGSYEFSCNAQQFCPSCFYPYSNSTFLRTYSHVLGQCIPLC